MEYQAKLPTFFFVLAGALGSFWAKLSEHAASVLVPSHIYRYWYCLFAPENAFFFLNAPKILLEREKWDMQWSNGISLKSCMDHRDLRRYPEFRQHPKSFAPPDLDLGLSSGCEWNSPFKKTYRSSLVLS